MKKSCVQPDGLLKSCVRVDGWKKSCVQTDGWKNSCGRADGSEKSCVRVDGSEKSCVRVDGSEKSCFHADDVQNSCVGKSSCVGVWKNGGAEIIANKRRNRNCPDADVKPIVRDPHDNDRILVESGAEMTLAPHEPSEFQKLKHQLTHIPFQPWRTSCVKGKAQAGPHKRTERIIKDSELPVIQLDYLMLKDVAATSGLKELSTCVRTFGYGMSAAVEMKGSTHTFATIWAVKMLNFLGLSDVILQCDPEPSLINKSKRSERTVIRNSPRRSHQSNGGVENYQKQLQGQVRAMLDQPPTAP